MLVFGQNIRTDLKKDLNAHNSVLKGYMTTKQYYWADVLRVFATFCVVWVHTTSDLVYKFKEIKTAYWWMANIVNSSLRMCVPLFFMLSGFLLLQKQEHIKDYFKKRFSRIGLPFLSWSVFYILWNVLYKHQDIDFLHAIYSIMIDNVYYHLWFLYSLIGLYLFIPILRIYIKNDDSKNIFYYIFLWFITVSFIPFVMKGGSAILGKQIRIAIDLRMAGFSGYLLIGFVLGKYPISKKWVCVSALMYSLCVLITALGTFAVSNMTNTCQDDFNSYLSPNVIIMSVSTFILLRYWGEQLNQHSRLSRIVKSLSSASFGIYLIHPMILQLFSDGKFGFTLDVLSGNAMLKIPVTASCAFLFSYIVIAGVLKVPILRKTV